MRETVFPLISVLLALAACGTSRESAGDTPAVGDAAPSLELSAWDGTRFSLTAARQTGPVVLVFYRGKF